MNHLVIKKSWMAFLIVFSCLLFEWRLFEWDPMHLFVYFLKGALVVFLLICVGVLHGFSKPKMVEHRRYYFFSAAFVLYAGVPSFLSVDPVESIEIWERLLEMGFLPAKPESPFRCYNVSALFIC